uniref:Uncharacterized protein n=1 Tax=Caenorhabditis japonica TaxID=281687 RepID=A0A8R1IK97_CAEJA
MHPNLTAQQVMDKNLAAFELREFADRIRAKYNRRMKQRQPRNYIGEMVKDGTMEKAKHRVKHPRGGEHMTLEQVLEWV